MKRLNKNPEINSNIEEKKHCYETLAPTDNSESKETINMLKDFIKGENITNIALSGKYGAGKTSILKTFFNNSDKEKYKPLYISLGMFGINKQGEIDDENVFCQEIEKSIIQQIIYKEKPNKLPDSNIKRIEKLPKRNIVFMAVVLMIAILIYILNLYEVNIGNSIKTIIECINNIRTINIIQKCNPLDFTIKGLIYAIIIAAIMCTIGEMAIVLSKIWRKIAIKSYKFKLPNTELEINKTAEESLLSKYMDELVYFFSKTRYNVIVIEDLDRFLENEKIRYRVLIIFQKLKELSIILNESKQVGRKIKFIYAVRDDLFKDETERTKFFDAIVPVIPVVSNFNSYAELKQRLIDENIPDKVIQDISAYVSDYRLIKNLCNEYFLYKIELGDSGITNEKIFSMIALKNIRPNLYEKLLNDSGPIYKLIKNKHRLYASLKQEIEENIQDNNFEIEKLSAEKLESLKELKYIAIGSVHEKNARYGGNGITAEKFLQDSITLDYIKDNEIYIRSQYGNNFGEEEIFEYFNGKAEFIKRAEILQNKLNKKIDKLKNDNIQLEKRIKKIQELSLKEVFNNIVIEDAKKIIDNYVDDNKSNNNLKEKENNTGLDDFVLMLVSNGYVDENYKNYMFRFKETDKIKISDYTYIINVRQGIVKDFDNNVSNPKEVIKQLDISYFGKYEILNYNILEELIQHNNLVGYKEKLNRVIMLLLNHNDENNRFVFGFLKHTQNQEDFLNLLYEADNDYFKELILYNMDEDKKENLDNLIKILLNSPLILENNETNKYIKDYVENRKDFEDYIELNENVQKSLKLLQVKFNTLEEQKSDKLINFIYNNNLYVINDNIVNKIFKFKGYTQDEYSDKNLSCILNENSLIKLKEYILFNPEEYIEECYLKTNNTKNSVKDIYDCINNWKIKKEIKNKIIKNMPIQIQDINNIVNTECDYYILENNMMKPTWANIYNIYLRNQKNLEENLIGYIENNAEAILKEKIADNIKSQEFTNFLGKIARNNDIEYEVYKKLLKEISYIRLNILKENEIESDRLKLLVERKMIKLSPENFDIINSQIPEIIDAYINNNIEGFVGEISKYSLDEYIIEKIIISNKVKPRYKTSILEKIDVDVINLNTMKYIVLNYSNNNISRLNRELKESIFSSNIELKYKILLLNKEIFKEYSIETLKAYIDIMPKPYNLIGNYQLRDKAFSLDNNKENLELLNNLIEKGLNVRYKLSTTNKKIVINNIKRR